MSEYSVEKVRAHARMLRECRINTEATRDRQQDKLADICDAYADLLERIKADESAADDKEKALADWGKSLNRRVEIETELFDCASGKKPLPMAEDCRRMALRLGTPDAHRPAQADEVAAKSPGFGIACTVTWTELFDAMTADGMNPPNKCGPATRKWVEQVVRDYLTRPPAQAAQAALSEALNALEDAAVNGHKLLGDDALRFRALVDRITPTAEPVAQGEVVDPLQDDSPLNSCRVFVESWRLESAGSNGHDLIANRNTVRRLVHIIDGLAAQPRAVPGNCLPFTNEVIDKMQDVMADHGFTVPVRVISEAFRTTRVALLTAAPSPGESA